MIRPARSWVSRSRVYLRYLTGERFIPDNILSKALEYLEEYEFAELTTSYDRLKALGLVREDGLVDYSLALQILAIASRMNLNREAVS